MNEAILGRAPKVVNVLGTPEGAAAITTLSQEQLDEIGRHPGTAAWLIEKHWLILGEFNDHLGLIPHAAFDLHNPKHRLALEDAAARGTLHICAAESMTGLHVDGMTLAIDMRVADREAIRMALAQ